MKSRCFVLGMLILFLIACQKEDKVYNHIEGEWKLVGVKLEDTIQVEVPAITILYSDCSASESSSGNKCAAVYKSNDEAQDIQFEITSDRNEDYIQHRFIDTNADTARLDVEGQIIFHLLSSMKINGFKTKEMTMETWSEFDKFFYQDRNHNKVELTFSKQ